MDFTLNNYIRKPFLKHQLGRALNWLLPRACLICGASPQPDHPCCADCYPKLPFQNGYCQQCGQAFAAEFDHCGRCISHPPAYDRCFCAFKYETPISDHICRLKYNERPELAKSLAQLLAQELLTEGPERPELLVPVPMHTSRLRERGFNQSYLIARELGKLLNIPVANNLIQKHRKTQPQAEQNLTQRQNNITGSFRAIRMSPAERVAIIDDVVTSGATAQEIAKLLKRSGVVYCQIWGVAHTI